jgi:Putative methyltransferase
VEYIRGKTSAEIDADELVAGLAGFSDVLIDIGTGDGRYVLHVARTRPTWFALGVDACRENLREASRKASPNTLYVIANAFTLPGELAGMASKVTINFPWGSLLMGLLDGEPMLLEGLLAIARPGATLEIRLNAGALTEAGHTLESGGVRMRQALAEGGVDVRELVRLVPGSCGNATLPGPNDWPMVATRAVCLRATLAGDTEAREEAYVANGPYTRS